MCFSRTKSRFLRSRLNSLLLLVVPDELLERQLAIAILVLLRKIGARLLLVLGMCNEFLFRHKTIVVLVELYESLLLIFTLGFRRSDGDGADCECDDEAFHGFCWVGFQLLEDIQGSAGFVGK